MKDILKKAGALTGFGQTLSRMSLIWAVSLPAAAQIVLDGEFNDWPEGVAGTADEHFLHLRLIFPEQISLQTSDLATSVFIDLDGDAGTGGSNDLFPGAELELMFAPVANRNAQGVGGGAALRVYNPQGGATDLPHQALGFVAMPTYANHEYELRIPRYLLRHETATDLLKASRPVTASPVRAKVVRLAADESVHWQSEEIAIAALPPAASQVPLASNAVPHKPNGAVRVISVNVEWAAPVDNPAPFVRAMRALNPDIYLLQEWDKPAFVLPEGSTDRRFSEQEMVAWFSTHLDPGRDWYASRNQELGIIIVSAFPLSALLAGQSADDALRYQFSYGAQSLTSASVRFSGALAHTPIGDLTLANIHLRCCGYYGSREDQNRLSESVAVNTMFRAALRANPSGMGLIAGDYNLVGSRLPREIIAKAADAGGTDLQVLEALNLRGDANITWRDARSGFSPSRLDYLLYTGSTLNVQNRFLFDSEELSDAELGRLGLQRDDSRFSDHLPLVMDVIAQP